MIIIKSPREIELMRAAGQVVAGVFKEIKPLMRAGVSTKVIADKAEAYIKSKGAKPTFKNYNGFPGAVCISVNDIVIHGIPSKRTILKEGDIVSVDCGTIYKGFYGDSAYTFPVGEIDAESAKLLKVTKESLYLGVQKAVAGNRIGDIGAAVQQYAEQAGFSVVREMVGHGIGKNMHESPEVPNYGKQGKGKKLSEGMVICIEPMINAGKKDIYLHNNGWEVSTADKKRSAHFEFMVAVRAGKPDVLTTFDYIENNF